MAGKPKGTPMLEAILIIVALGGLEVLLWWADHRRQSEQLATLEAIWAELATMNEERPHRPQPSPLPLPAAEPAPPPAAN
jgi:hypothetical protein